MTQRAASQKIKIQIGLHQILVCALKDTINKGKHTTELEKVIVNHVFDKDLVSKMYRELLQLNNKMMTNNSLKNR